jgi:hypothetical protein
MKIPTCIVFILIVVFGLSGFVSAQETVVKNENRELMQFENVEIKGQGVSGLLSRISFGYEVPIGFEVASNEDELMMHSFDFKKGTLSDLLTQFVKEHNQYTWEINDGVVNVFPKDGYRDPQLKELSEIEVGTFSIKKGTSCYDVGKSLANAPEIKEFLEYHEMVYRGQERGGFYIMQLGRDFTLDVSNTKLKAILNKVVKESPIAKFWLVRRNGYDQSISINFSARQEDAIKLLPRTDFLHQSHFYL